MRGRVLDCLSLRGDVLTEICSAPVVSKLVSIGTVSKKVIEISKFYDLNPY